MRRHHWACAAAVVTALVSLSSSVSAQTTPTRSFQEASLQVAPGDRVEVVVTDGSIRLGRVLSLSADRIVIDVDGKTVDLSSAEVAQLSVRGDAIRNGVIRGTMIGGLSALGVGGALAALFWEGKPGGDEHARVFLVLTGMGVGIGAGLGAVFDLVRDGKTVVFKAERRQTFVAPILGDRQKGLAVTVCF